MALNSAFIALLVVILLYPLTKQTLLFLEWPLLSQNKHDNSELSDIWYGAGVACVGFSEKEVQSEWTVEGSRLLWLRETPKKMEFQRIAKKVFEKAPGNEEGGGEFSEEDKDYASGVVYSRTNVRSCWRRFPCNIGRSSRS